MATSARNVTGVKVIDKLPEFSLKAKIVFNDALKEAGRDTLIDAKTNAPFLKGGLRGDSGITQTRPLALEVHFDIEYASYQERGSRKDGSRRVRHYSNSGGAHFLENAGDKQQLKLASKFRKHAVRVRV